MDYEEEDMKEIESMLLD